ncbi:MAG: hypothetical protein V8T86_11500 [Victivallis sp.]
MVQKLIDGAVGEIDSKILRQILDHTFVFGEGPYRMENYQRASVGDRFGATFTWFIGGEKHELTGQGNGPLRQWSIR